MAVLLAACAGAPPVVPPPARQLPSYTAAEQLLLLDRLTWGANAAAAREMERLGAAQWIERQLKAPATDDLPPEAAELVASLNISRRTALELAGELARKQSGYMGMDNAMQKTMEQDAYYGELQRYARESAVRSLLRAVYSPWQLREQMTWFWVNHFSVSAASGEVGATVGDYEQNAVRPHVLGRFRDLLGAVAKHPAMLRYLENAENAFGHLNENYARELMELHTLGVDGGYTQKDVQELARLLTGFGVSARDPSRWSLRSPRYVREGMFEFNPKRHDYGDKVLLGKPIRASGVGELDEALDRLASHPSTARSLSRKLAVFLVADEPPAALVERMAAVWMKTDGNIAEVVREAVYSEELKASLHSKFKDPVQYVYSALRLADDGQSMQNPWQALQWLRRMGQSTYARVSPDGYPLTRDAWAGAGQLTARFEVARAIAYEANARVDGSMSAPLGAATRKPLDSAASPEERTLLLLASPEFMRR